MLDRNRLALALDIHARSYRLLKWIGAAIDDGRIPAGAAARHSDDPTAANEWIDCNYGLIPAQLRPERQHLRAFANSTYGYWLIQRLDGYTDGPAVLALWREIAWSRMGSPIQGFHLRLEDFVNAETAIVESVTASTA